MHAKVGDPLEFIVENDVNVGDVTVIRAGTVAQGSVLGVKGRRVLGIGGQVVFGLNDVTLVNGETVGLHARGVVKGNSHTWRMIAGMAVTGLFYIPAAPVFLLTRGGTSTVLKGTEVTAHLDCGTSVASANLPKASKDTSDLNDVMENLPSRVLTGEGREGDMVNLVFVAQKDELQAAFARAGWIKPDPWKPVMAWHLFTQRLHYAKLPMARFYLFGRVQDYSYAMPDPDAIVSRRHHIRIWKTRYTVGGEPLWAGAATFDIAITFAKNGRIFNHTIDPHVDTERDFVGTNLAGSSPVHREYLSPGNPVFEAQTASGEDYQSDSKILMLDFHQTGVVTATSPAASSTVAQSVVKAVPILAAGPQAGLK